MGLETLRSRSLGVPYERLRKGARLGRDGQIRGAKHQPEGVSQLIFNDYFTRMTNVSNKTETECEIGATRCSSQLASSQARDRIKAYNIMVEVEDT